jgi:CDP-diacylglycerol---glycerol-3-phosphate 3-phosphatidyltransferase
MISEFIGKICTSILDRIVLGLSYLKVNPNLITFVGFLITLPAAWFLARGSFFWAGWVIVLSGLFDMLDGRVARVTNSVTNFGAFFDSVLDRYCDMAFFVGMMIYYSKSHRTGYIALSAIAMMGTVVTSYARSRAECLIPLCKVGFLERPERLVLLSIGTFFNRMAPVLWIIAVLSNLTVIHRIVYTWKEAQKIDHPLQPET